ncbi:hypothetical protein BO71DRAFT_414162 [Aspergillus ellipticus CBS 707.79]|uniref:Uncharacterized protein n=1 Tax=Aspergillus ellipticus CBS 707.79 TaxID=1448320 RepID=A0A319DBF2_9EURO|nr:hypothetical protein BO71DRAFT_414162 [Aspergillus ellipticus CBS 707.79]
MPYSFKKSLDLLGRSQGLVSLPLASSPTLPHLPQPTPYTSDLNACGLFSPSDCTKADARWVPEEEPDYIPESEPKEQTHLSLPCCQHSPERQPGMEDVPLDGKALDALQEYSNAFDQSRLLKRRLSTLTHSPRYSKVR